MGELVLLQHVQYTCTVCIILSLISSLFRSYLPFVGMVTILMNDYPVLKVSAAVLHAHDPFSQMCVYMYGTGTMGQKYCEVSSFQRLQVYTWGVGKDVLVREVSSFQRLQVLGVGKDVLVREVSSFQRLQVLGVGKDVLVREVSSFQRLKEYVLLLGVGKDVLFRRCPQFRVSLYIEEFHCSVHFSCLHYTPHKLFLQYVLLGGLAVFVLLHRE